MTIFVTNLCSKSMWDSAAFFTMGDMCLRSITTKVLTDVRAQPFEDWFVLTCGVLGGSSWAEVGSSILTRLLAFLIVSDAISEVILESLSNDR